MKKNLDNMRSIGKLMDKIKRNIKKENVNKKKEDDDKIEKKMKKIVEDMYEKK